MSRSALGAFLDRRIEAGDFPGGVALVARGDTLIELCARGRSALEPEEHAAAPHTVFDLGEMSGALVTAPLALLLHDLEGLDLGSPVLKLLPELDRLDKREITLRDLILQRSGMPEWMPLYARGLGMRDYLRQLRETSPQSAPGAQTRDSAIDSLLLGEAVARAGSAPLEKLAQELLFSPLGTSSLGYGPRPASERPRIAPTERDEAFERERARRHGDPRAKAYCGWRSGVLWGEVHDHCTWTLGGVGGGAGVFATAGDLRSLAMEILGRGRGIFSERVRSLLCREGVNGRVHGQEGRTHGLKTVRAGEAGPLEVLPPGCVGRDSFTGASLWIDPHAAGIYVLLVNCIHPQVRAADRIAMRREFHSLAVALP